MSQPKIGFFCEAINYRPKNIKIIRTWITDTIVNEGKTPGEISVIFCNDSFLLDMNIKYLGHDTLTDIITFDYNEGSVISGDIFISIERVKENAGVFSKSFADELHRVIIHGVLHLCGYKDKSQKDQLVMRGKEETYLANLPHL
ncbi:MAG: rRNA maturation RNase YbeY [Lentimicrobium sp.]